MKYFLACTFLIGSFIVAAQPAFIGHGEFYLSGLFDHRIGFDTTAANSEETISEEASAEEAWKSWETVENFAYGKNRGSLPMITDLRALHPYFHDKIVQLIALCKAKGIDLAVVETFRTHAKQAEYFAMGRKYTMSKSGKSRHQYGLAADLVPVVDSVAVWNNAALWKKIGVIGEKLGLRWGGRWRSLYDPAHFEWTGGVTISGLAKGLQPAIPESQKSAYPCLEEELRQLRANREAWEVEQAVSARNQPKRKTR